jgi:DNA replication and repair protein RecF
VFGEALAGRREQDMERGHTSIGPHRDDLLLEIDGRPLRLYGSHGQARTALVSLKLAELEYYAESYDRQPLLLMDEVASVLDRTRADELIGLLMTHSSQVVVTSPREEDLGGLAGTSHRLIRINKGMVAE